ncbi:MAG: PIN domain-containing protein [Cyanobacteria bacterium J06648_1]
MRVFLDANILFSGSVSGSKITKLIEIVQQHGECVTNIYAVEEARKNIGRKKYGSISGLESLLQEITISSDLVLNVPVELKSKDIPILGGAIALQCTHLLTGDKKDFGFLYGQQVANVLIVSPRLLAEEMVAKGLIERK